MTLLLINMVLKGLLQNMVLKGFYFISYFKKIRLDIYKKKKNTYIIIFYINFLVLRIRGLSSQKSDRKVYRVCTKNIP